MDTVTRADTQREDNFLNFKVKIPQMLFLSCVQSTAKAAVSFNIVSFPRTIPTLTKSSWLTENKEAKIQLAEVKLMVWGSWYDHIRDFGSAKACCAELNSRSQESIKEAKMILHEGAEATQLFAWLSDVKEISGLKWCGRRLQAAEHGPHVNT